MWIRNRLIMGLITFFVGALLTFLGVNFPVFAYSDMPALTPEVVSNATSPPQEPTVSQFAQPEILPTATDTPTNDCQISEQFPDSIRQWCDLITYYSALNGHDPNLIAALILQESAGDPLAYSKSGAVGLMQVMPHDGKAKEFKCKNGPCFADRPSIAELQDPEFNIAWGTRFLSDLLALKGNYREALKAYGPKDVGYYYADIVLNLYEQYKQ